MNSPCAASTSVIGAKLRNGAYNIDDVFEGLQDVCAFPAPLYRYQLYVDNLPPNTTDMDLLKMFSPFGAIRPGGTKAMLASDGTCTGIGYVNFNSQREALAAASALNQVILSVGQALIVKAASKKVVDSSAWDVIEEAADKKT